jgi:hypothetical protein
MSFRNRSRWAMCNRWLSSKTDRNSLQSATLRPIRSAATIVARWRARMVSPRATCLSTCARAISTNSRFMPLSTPLTQRRPRALVNGLKFQTETLPEKEVAGTFGDHVGRTSRNFPRPLAVSWHVAALIARFEVRSGWSLNRCCGPVRHGFSSSKMKS